MLISVVITSYNYQKYLKDTINSVISQTFTDWEMVIIDDASTDASVEIIREFAKNDNRIKFIVNEKNLGLAKSLQKGIENASGEWIAFLESDDMLKEDCLEKKAAIIKQYPDVGMVFNDVELFGDEERIKNVEKRFSKSAKILKNKTYPCNLFIDISNFNRILTFSTVLVNKEKFIKCSFDTPYDKFIDWWIFLHFARENQFYYIPEKLTKWRMHKDSYINKKESFLYLPVNLYALVDIIKKERNPYIIPYLIYAFFYSLRIIIVKLNKFIKFKLGIPLKS